MRYININTLVLSIALLASSATAALVTTTLPWADGNTLLLSVTTDAAGDVLTQTM
ncbi:hypothetical protein BCR39DRAFT_545996 [Naematelia encephala]|uniref:Uncharacterized protein n=1 Tax=Naematelia encephala TaxID=71784 RepID=A0A1Y2AR02_9TREE|nr:hypothetical protein BCR39DRAFT_545996 [Naematelia encephala]